MPDILEGFSFADEEEEDVLSGFSFADEKPDVLTGFSFADESEPHIDESDKDDWQITKGLKAGIDQLGGIGAGLAGIAGDLVGFDRLKDWGLDTYQSQMAEAAQHEGRVPSYTDVNNVSDAVDYAMYGIGTVLPMFVPSLVTGGAGAVAARSAVKKGVSTYVKEETARQVAKGVVEKEAAQIAAQKAVQRGMAKGAFAGSAGIEAGSIYGDVYEQTGEEAPLVALGFGAVAGALDALPVMGVLKKMGFADTAKKQISKELREGLGTAVGKQILTEAGTEGLQTIVERAAVKWVDDQKDIFTPEGWEEITNATILGGLAGGTIGGTAHAAKSALSPKAEPITPADVEQELTNIATNLDQATNVDEVIDIASQSLDEMMPVDLEGDLAPETLATMQPVDDLTPTVPPPITSPIPQTLDQMQPVSLPGEIDPLNVDTMQPVDITAPAPFVRPEGSPERLQDMAPVDLEQGRIPTTNEQLNAVDQSGLPTIDDMQPVDLPEQTAIAKFRADRLSEPKQDPLLGSQDWRKMTLKAKLPDGSDVEIEAGVQYDSITARKSYAQQILDCVNASA